MTRRIMGLILAAAVTGSLTAGPLETPAEASTGSTLTTIAGIVALVGGIILYNNYEHKRQAANTIVGYTRNGGVVYGDGRIVLPNGQTIYPNANGTYPWGQAAYYQPQASGYQYTSRPPSEYRTYAYRYRASSWAQAEARYNRTRYSRPEYSQPRYNDESHYTNQTRYNNQSRYNDHYKQAHKERGEGQAHPRHTPHPHGH